MTRLIKFLLIPLVVILFSLRIAYALPIGYTVNVSNNNLATVDLATGTLTNIGATGFGAVRGLAFRSDGTLFGIDQITDELLTFDLATGAGTAVGSLGVGINGIGGIAFSPTGILFFAEEFGSGENLYTVDTGTGAATLVGSIGASVTALAFDASGTLFGYADTPDNILVTINTAIGAATTIGSTGNSESDGGISFASDGTLYAVFASGAFGTFNTATGSVTILGNTGGQLSALAIRAVPEPASLALLGIGLAGLGFARKNKAH